MKAISYSLNHLILNIITYFNNCIIQKNKYILNQKVNAD